MRTLIRVLIVTAALMSAAGAGAQTDSRHPQPTPPAGPAPSNEPMFHARTSGQAVTGELAPDFVLDGSEGKPVKLSSLRGRWMLLIFAERKEDVAPFRRVHAQIDSSGVRMAAVCAEKGYVVENYVRREKLPFLIMADFSREVCDMYGLVEGPATVMPGYLLINPKGEIVMTMLGQSLPPEDVARLAIYVAGRQ